MRGLARLIGRKPVERHWDTLGARNAYGAILTGEGGAVPEWDADAFFATGRADVERFMADLLRLAPDVPRRRALDFGCGVGRITRALSDHFAEVAGVDAAPSMVERARALNQSQTRCTFALNREPNLRLFDTARFDVVYSRLVLQHIESQVVRRYIPEFVRVLGPGGVLMFQLPEPVNAEQAFCEAPVTGNAFKRWLPASMIRPWRRFKYRLIVDLSARMEMFGVSRDEVLSLVAGAGGRILEVQPDQSHGQDVPGYAYWVTTGEHRDWPAPPAPRTGRPPEPASRLAV